MILFFIGAFLDYPINGPQAWQMKEALKAELAQLPPPASATLFDAYPGSESAKPRTAYVFENYRSDDTYEQCDRTTIPCWPAAAGCSCASGRPSGPDRFGA